MSELKISLSDAIDNPWIWNFLQNNYSAGFWPANKIFEYEGKRFSFTSPVLARTRKNPQRGYAFEEINPNFLGKGSFGEVYPIKNTLSIGKHNELQVTDKERVVKKLFKGDIKEEYESMQHIKHLHAKLPQKNYIVMKKMKGVSLNKLINNHTLTMNQKLKLTKKLLEALQSQVEDNGLRHNDLHSSNILVEHDTVSDEFYVNIIDYGKATTHDKSQLDSGNLDLKNQMAYHIYCLWQTVYDGHISTYGTPKDLIKLTRVAIEGPPIGISVFAKGIDQISFCPTTVSQYTLDKIIEYIRNTSLPKETKMLLETNFKDAASRSTPQNLTPLRESLLNCYNVAKKNNINTEVLTKLFFIESPNHHKALVEIFSWLDRLEQLGKAHKTVSNLVEFANNIRINIFHCLSKEQNLDFELLDNRCCQYLMDNEAQIAQLESRNILARVSVSLGAIQFLSPIVSKSLVGRNTGVKETFRNIKKQLQSYKDTEERTNRNSSLNDKGGVTL